LIKRPLCVCYTALRRKSKDWLVRNQNNVSEWSDMSIHGLSVYKLTIYVIHGIYFSIIIYTINVMLYQEIFSTKLEILRYFQREFRFSRNVSKTGIGLRFTIKTCSFTKHTALRSKSKDWLIRNQNNVSEWSDMSIRGLLFQ
jgi:hypothetical protein